jgi:hypothetical protein
MLRLDARRHAGTALRPEKERYLNNWISQLQSKGAVVAYSPTKGFYYTASRSGIDDGLIRKPNWLIEREVDEGTLPSSALDHLSPVVS